jgi:hypothetical protein
MASLLFYFTTTQLEAPSQTPDEKVMSANITLRPTESWKQLLALYVMEKWLKNVERNGSSLF